MSVLQHKIKRLSEEIHERISREPMTPLERAEINARCKEPDRIPIGLQVHDQLARLCKLSVKEICTDPYKLIFSQLYGMKLYGHENTRARVDTYNLEAEACGSRLKFPDNSLPVIVDHAVKKPEDLEHLRIPDPYKDGRLPIVLEAQRLLVEKLGDIFPVGIEATAPFSIAANLRGFTNLIMDTRRNPGFVNDLLDFSSEVVTEYVRAQQGLIGKRSPTLADAYASIQLIGPRIFEEFVLPSTTKLLRSFSPNGSWQGVWGISELQDWKRFFLKVLDTGTRAIQVLHPDTLRIDLREAKHIAFSNERVLVVGVEAELIRFGSRSAISLRIRDHLRAIAPGGGASIFGAMIPYDTPPERVKFFVNEAKRYGTYPIK
jgi:uroporphyrinogen decarboxylase